MAAAKKSDKLKVEQYSRITIPARYVWGDTLGDIANYTKKQLDNTASSATLNAVAVGSSLVVQNEGCDEPFKIITPHLYTGMTTEETDEALAWAEENVQ